MSNNYYLYLGIQYDPQSPIYSIDFVVEQEDGYVWHDQFYKTLEELNKDYYCILHIGKSVENCNFLLCSYPELGLKTADDWFILSYTPIKCQGIYDENGIKISPAELLTIMTDAKSTHDYSFNEIMNYCKENNMLYNFDTGLFVYTDDKYMRITHTDENYDITPDWGFN